MKAESPASNSPWTNPWVWLAIAIPTISVGLSFTMLYVAVVNKDSEVKDDWYKDKKAISQDMHRDKLATTLELAARVAFQGAQVTVSVSAPGMLPENADARTLTLLLSHPTDIGKDVQTVLTRTAPGQYAGMLPKTVTGRYYVEIGCPVWRLKETGYFPTDAVDLKAKPI